MPKIILLFSKNNLIIIGLFFEKGAGRPVHAAPVQMTILLFCRSFGIFYSIFYRFLTPILAEGRVQCDMSNTAIQNFSRPQSLMRSNFWEKFIKFRLQEAHKAGIFILRVAKSQKYAVIFFAYDVQKSVIFNKFLPKVHKIFLYLYSVNFGNLYKIYTIMILNH